MVNIKKKKGRGWLYNIEQEPSLFEVKARAEGFAINKLFEKSLFSYQGAIWMISSAPDSESIIINQNDWNIIRNKIIDTTSIYDKRSDLLFNEDVNEFRFIKPKVLRAEIPEKMKYFKCYNGHINEIMYSIDLRKCKFCESKELQQIPIFIKRYYNYYAPDPTLVSGDPHSIYTDVVYGNNLIPYSNRMKCPSCHKNRKLKTTSRNYPVRYLKWLCDCGRMPDDFRTPRGRQNLFSFRPDFPFENLFVALTTRFTTPNDNVDLVEAKNILDSELHHLNMLSYSNQMEVYDLCYSAVSNKKLFTFEGSDKKTIYARKFKTKGLVFQFNNSLWDMTKKELEDNLDKIANTNQEAADKIRHFISDDKLLKIAILHTFKHMILFQLPMLIGIEPGKISGDYFYSESESFVYIFDNENGGIGVCETIKDDLVRFGKLFLLAKDKIKNCKRDPHCNGSCKVCTYIENCGSLNSNLNRYLLFPMFNLNFDELGFF